MMERLDKFTTNQRLLLGLGIPFVGSVLLWMLWPFPMEGLMVMQAYGGLGGLRSFLLIGAIILLCGGGAFFVGSVRSLALVPLALFFGYLLGMYFVDASMPHSAVYLLRYMIPVLLEAFVGALLGLVVARRGGTMGLGAWARMVQQQAKVALHSAPTQLSPSSAPAAKTPAQPETLPASNPVPAQEPAEQDDIARVLAEMQQEFAQSKQQAPNTGTHQTI